MSTPEESRPRPQYGEYATPEEQRARILQPAPDAGSPHTPPAAPAPYIPHPPAAPATTTAARPSRTGDRIITIALLAYGLVTVITAVPQLLDFTGFAEAWMEMAGVEEPFTNTAQGAQFGAIGAVVFVVGWVVTALLSWRSLARRRLTWWIPLVGAIVTFVAVSAFLTVPLLGDPAIASHFAGLGG